MATAFWYLHDGLQKTISALVGGESILREIIRRHKCRRRLYARQK